MDFCNYFSRSRLEEVPKDMLQFRIGTPSTQYAAVVDMINRRNVCLKHGVDVRVVPKEKCVIWQYTSHSPQCGPRVVVIHRQKIEVDEGVRLHLTQSYSADTVILIPLG